MKKNIFLTYLLFFGVFSSVFCQLRIKGRVLDKKNNIPIPYANIGIINTGNGTISNSDGSFTIKVSEENLTKEVLFSAIGFEQQSIPLAALINSEENTIRLKEKITVLEEVLITNSSKKYKNEWLGNRKRHLMVQGVMQVDSVSAGGAMALLIDKKKNFNYVQNAALFITRNTRPEFKVRLRFLSVDKANNNMPGEDLFNESIVIKSSIQRGWLDFDVSQYYYRIPQDSFFLMFEWIIEDIDRVEMFMTLKKYQEQNPDKIKKDSVYVDGNLVATQELSTNAPIPIIAFGTTKTKSDLRKYKCYSRGSSFAEWNRSTSIISAKVLMSTTPSQQASSDEGTSETQEETIISKIEKWGEAFRENYNIPGMQLSVSERKKTIFSKGFGYSDVQNDEKVTSQTRFRIASVTKPMTATAIIKLASEDKLDLDVDVRKYVPTFPEKKHTLTTRQLAGHLGGIRDYYEDSIDEVIGNPHFENATEATNVFKNDTLMSKPGDQYVYSSFGYNLIGAAIEGASGQTYLEYMQEHIWNPLLMFNTYGDIADSTMVNKSKFYYPNEEEAEPYDLSYGHASGGIISTTDDLLKFGIEIIYGNFIKYNFKKQMFKTQYTKDGKPTPYGLGWYIAKDMNGKKIWYHVGQGPSSGAILLVYPKDDIVISLLSNTPILVNSDNGLPVEVLKLAELIYQK
ncbi:serine hydrolase [Aquimarina sp. LLG6339-5]|uniref:serine hydrolase n=1 Tax=Aquimarina sp. LLG6339-5 TaxID=3160830 RepID=UPI003864F9D8